MRPVILMLALTFMALAGCASQPSDNSASSGASASHDYKGEHK